MATEPPVHLADKFSKMRTCCGVLFGPDVRRTSNLCGVTCEACLNIAFSAEEAADG